MDRLPASITAELTKLRTLPIVLAAVLATIAAAVLVAAAITASDAGSGAASGAGDGSADGAVTVIQRSVAYLQLGPIVLGILAAATEYAGQQVRTTLIAVPDRIVVLAGKCVAQLTVATATSVLALAAVVTTVWLRGRPDDVASWAMARPVAGAAAYLVLIGLVAHALAVLVRSMIPALVAMLTLVLVASPVLGPLSDLVRWLPDQAGRGLYLSDTAPGPWGGTLVLLGWVVATGSVAVIAFLHRDA